MGKNMVINFWILEYKTLGPEVGYGAPTMNVISIHIPDWIERQPVFYWESCLFFWAQLAQLSDWADATDPWLQVACDYWDHGHHSGTCIAGICWSQICFLELLEFLELPGFRRWRPRRIVWATYSVLWHIQHLRTCAQRFRMVHRKHQWSHKAVGSRLEMKKPEFIFNVIEQAFLDFNCLSPKMGTLNPRVYHHHARWNGNCGVCTVSGQTHLPSCACLLRLSGAASKAKSKEPVSWSPVVPTNAEHPTQVHSGRCLESTPCKAASMSRFNKGAPLK